MKTQFQVIVGNVGYVYEGNLFKEALQHYAEYKRQSMNEYGRAAGEDVTLMKDQEPLYEYFGTFNEELINE